MKMDANLTLAALLLVLCVNLGLAWDEPEPTGSNVCTRSVWTSGWYVKRVSYTCWTYHDAPCDQRRDRWRRGTGHGWYERYERPMCQVGRSRTCWKSRRVCGRQQMTVRYCCPGYEQTTDNTCERVIKCGTNNGGCSQQCRHGRTEWEDHSCGCYPGYEKMSSGTDCKNINECEKNKGGCSHQCHDTPGGYYCSCPPGFELIGPHNCSERNECKLGNGGCQHNCVNTVGRYYCTCREGYKLVNGSACLDIDECMKFNGHCMHGCMNTAGSFKCICKPGFKLATNGFKCIEDEDFKENLGPDGGKTNASGIERQGLGPESGALAAGHGPPIGLIVGCIIGALLLLLLILLLVLLARRYGDRLQALAHRNQPRTENPYEVPASGAGFDNHAYGHMGPVLVLPVPIKGKKELIMSGPVVSAEPLKPKGEDITVANGTYERPVTSNDPSTTAAYENMLYGAGSSAPPAPSEDDAIYANAATVKAAQK